MKGSLLVTLRTAGDLTATVARNLRVNGYTVHDGDGPDHGAAVALLADALVEDFTGHSALNDRYILSARSQTPDAKRDARDRQAIREAVRQSLHELPDDHLRLVIDHLAAGDGDRAADLLRTQAQLYADALIARVQADAAYPATTAS